MSNNILLNEFNKLKKKISNGCNTYGSFSSYKHQNIINNDGFVIEKHINIKNIHHLNNSPNIKFLKSGIFVINLIMYLSENAQIAFYNNGNLLGKTITSINVGISCLAAATELSRLRLRFLVRDFFTQCQHRVGCQAQFDLFQPFDDGDRKPHTIEYGHHWGAAGQAQHLDLGLLGQNFAVINHNQGLVCRSTGRHHHGDRAVLQSQDGAGRVNAHQLDEGLHDFGVEAPAFVAEQVNDRVRRRHRRVFFVGRCAQAIEAIRQ